MSEMSYRTVNPYIVADDADAELTFLEAAFGGRTTTCARNDDGSVMHAEIAVGDSLVMLGQASERWKATRAALYLWIDDVDATFAQAKAAGGRVESEPADMPYGHRHGGIVDPAGNTWWIASPVRSTT